MVRSLLTSLCCLLSFVTNAQPLLQLGHRDSVQSKILGEQRQLLIYLPSDYDRQKKYPVAYLLDGETHFHMFTGIVQHLGNYAIPEMIVVGIVNVNRNRDYPPTRDTSTYDPDNGRGEVFTSFLEKELIPYMDAHYATAPYRLLAGHSLGGLLVINTVLRHPDLFRSYIAVDPSLWWDRMNLAQQTTALLSRQNRNGYCLFLGLSGIVPEQEKEVVKALRDTSDKTMDIRSVLLFRQQLQLLSGTAPRWASKSYPDEAHGSVPLPAYYDGLRFVFDFYKRPSLAVLTDTTVRMLAHHYEQVSGKMGYTILPPEFDLSGLAWRSAVLEKNLDRAFLYLQTYLQLYPNSPQAHNSMAGYYSALGDTLNARIYSEKARSLSRE